MPYQELTEKKCNARLDYLLNALKIASGTGFLSFYNRLMINKERSALYGTIREIQERHLFSAKPEYQIPLTIEKIITRIYKSNL